jgi:hypothetical protein
MSKFGESVEGRRDLRLLPDQIERQQRHIDAMRPLARQAFTAGYWCTDFIFEYDGPCPRLANENRWMLPRRWRMAGAFKSSLVGEPLLGGSPPGRRSRDGNLAIFINADHPVDTIKIPAAYESIAYALTSDGA